MPARLLQMKLSLSRGLRVSPSWANQKNKYPTSSRNMIFALSLASNSIRVINLKTLLAIWFAKYSYRLLFNCKLNVDTLSPVCTFPWPLAFSTGSWRSPDAFVWYFWMNVLEHGRGQLSSVMQCLLDLVVKKFHKDCFGIMVCLYVQADEEAFSSLFEKITCQIHSAFRV